MTATAPRPALRGWSHAAVIAPVVAGWALLMVHARDDTLKLATVAVYGATLTLLFSVSALYHCRTWNASARSLLRRIDHADISLLIAATYTPVVGVLLGGAARILLLAGVWSAALLGAALSLFDVHLRRSLLVALYIATGWIALLALPALYQRIGAGGVAVLVCGGLLYSAGAVLYAVQRPKLWPRVFGYHEVFHLLVIAATAVFFGFIAAEVVPG
ncbi:MAG: hemolysin III family protein [Candidatus Dormibacteraeota bacterium]|nr:hemolysin III family protein [Candidatus Dormibacteraeota bacterium]